MRRRFACIDSSPWQPRARDQIALAIFAASAAHDDEVIYYRREEESRSFAHRKKKRKPCEYPCWMLSRLDVVRDLIPGSWLKLPNTRSVVYYRELSVPGLLRSGVHHTCGVRRISNCDKGKSVSPSVFHIYPSPHALQPGDVNLKINGSN